MAYKLKKQSPYSHKKISLKKRICSAILTMFICGSLIIVSGRIANMYRISNAAKQYETTISLYDEIVKATALYIQRNGGDNPESCFRLYTQLLWDGYLANNGNYRYNIEDQNNIIGNYGARIATGEGDCKNNEDFFYKVMKLLGYDAYLVACIQKPKLPQEFIMGNHMITIVSYEGKEYYFDATNVCSYQKVGINHIQNENKRLEVVLKPLVSYIYGYNDAIETFHLLLNAPNLESGEAFEVGEQTVNSISASKKILVLRKQIEPQLQMICNTIVGEG